MINPDSIGGRLGNRIFQLVYLYAKARQGEIPNIYVQNYRLFDKYRTELQSLFGEGIGNLPYVAIHLRRGDYVGNPFYCQLWETRYYRDAINRFPNRTFMVFTDDLPFAETHFEGDRFLLDESETDLKALNTMASCADFIIANSSFSFWAAYLSPNQQEGGRPFRRQVVWKQDRHSLAG